MAESARLLAPKEGGSLSRCVGVIDQCFGLIACPGQILHSVPQTQDTNQRHQALPTWPVGYSIVVADFGSHFDHTSEPDVDAYDRLF
jgi:hypothetical protein